MKKSASVILAIGLGFAAGATATPVPTLTVKDYQNQLIAKIEASYKAPEEIEIDKMTCEYRDNFEFSGVSPAIAIAGGIGGAAFLETERPLIDPADDGKCVASVEYTIFIDALDNKGTKTEESITYNNSNPKDCQSICDKIRATYPYPISPQVINTAPATPNRSSSDCSACAAATVLKTQCIA